MICLAPAHAGTLFLLAQNGAQPSPDKTIEPAEQAWSGVFEILKPPPQHRVEISDDLPKAVAPAADRPRSHLVLEGFQTLGADKTHTSLEPVAQKVEPLARVSAVTHLRLVRVQGQAIGIHPRRYLAQGRRPPPTMTSLSI